MAKRLCYALVFALLVCASAWAELVDEYSVKAVFLLNFARFTEWPDTSRSAITLCILGKDPFGATIDRMIGSKVGKRSLTVKRLQMLDGSANCQIVFISRSLAGRVTSILDEVPAGVLTVGDSEGLARQGVMINMTLSSDSVSFEVNNDAVKRAGLTISSKLLRLATAVY